MIARNTMVSAVQVFPRPRQVRLSNANFRGLTQGGGRHGRGVDNRDAGTLAARAEVGESAASYAIGDASLAYLGGRGL